MPPCLLLLGEKKLELFCWIKLKHTWTPRFPPHFLLLLELYGRVPATKSTTRPGEAKKKSISCVDVSEDKRINDFTPSIPDFYETLLKRVLSKLPSLPLCSDRPNLLIAYHFPSALWFLCHRLFEDLVLICGPAPFHWSLLGVEHKVIPELFCLTYQMW